MLKQRAVMISLEEICVAIFDKSCAVTLAGMYRDVGRLTAKAEELHEEAKALQEETKAKKARGSEYISGKDC